MARGANDPFAVVFGDERGALVGRASTGEPDWRPGRAAISELFAAVALIRAKDIAELPDAAPDGVEEIVDGAYERWESADPGERPSRRLFFHSMRHNIGQAAIPPAIDGDPFTEKLRRVGELAGCALLLAAELSASEYELLLTPLLTADRARRRRGGESA